MTNELKQFQEWVELNDVRSVDGKINSSSRDKMVKLLNTQLNGKTCIDIATGKNVGLEMWKLLLNCFNEKEIFGKNVKLDSFEQLLQSPTTPGNANSSSTPSHQMQKVEHFLDETCKVENENIKQLRLRFLCDLCRIQPSWFFTRFFTSNASEDDVLKLATKLIESYKFDLLNSMDMTYGLYPMHWAVMTSNIPLLRLFLKFRCEVNCEDLMLQGTPLHHIQTIKGHTNILEIVNILVEHRAGLYFERKRRGYTALHSILINLSISDVSYFLLNHIQEIVTESMPYPAVHGLIVHTVTSISKHKNGLEAERSREEIQVEIAGKIKFLHQRGIDIHTKDINGMNILHYACWFRYTVLVKYLLSAPFVKRDRLLVGDKFGRGCLFYAVDYPALKIWPDDEGSLTLEYLLKQKIDSNKNGCFQLNVVDLGHLEFIIINFLRLLKKNEAMQHIELFSRKFRNIGKPVDLKSRNSKEILGHVEGLVNKLHNSLNEVVPKYLDTVTLSGSVSEDTKINPLDEFDFLFKLKGISQDVSAGNFTIGDEVCLKSRTKHVCHNQTLNQYLYANFNNNVYNMLKQKTFWENLPFYWRTCYHLGGNPPDALVAPLCLKLIRDNQPDLDVDIDLVPIIALDDLPASMKEQIPHEIVDFITRKEWKWDVILRGKSDNARLSFSSIEKFILRRLRSEIKDAYTLAKRLLSRVDKTTEIDPEIITSYMFKNALFHELDPTNSYYLLDNDKDICLQTPEYINNDRISFVEFWTLKILNRLIQLFSTGNDVKIYCRPSVGFPDCPFFGDDDNDNPYIKVLNKCKDFLNNP
ncbi:uncharacterized protein LOC127724652 [Mytilus californianus]|uniref:uncharacterized protein LOC127724652 n=1 Tax=Mytilus californianus TaxID=6549 RepID=UPI002248502E|nr:uncharacterized protein LOC127724652 [Mytilus californianus]